MFLPNSRYGVHSSHCHRRIFVTEVPLAEEAKFCKHIRVSNSLLKIILRLSSMMYECGKFILIREMLSQI